jgi:hypothetical protein
MNVSGVLLIDLAPLVDKHGFICSGALSTVRGAPPGVTVEIHLGAARFVEPFFGARLAELLRPACAITVIGTRCGAVTALVTDLRDALAIDVPTPRSTCNRDRGPGGCAP